MEPLNIVIGIIFIILSIIVFIGKGGFLIAGFNTADEDEKKKYDEKKMNIVIGTSLWELAIMEILMGLWPIKQVVIPCFMIMALIIIAMFFIVNIKCKANNE